MKRRDFITLLGGAAAALILAPLPLGAQQTERLRRLGVLTGYDESDREARHRLAILRQRLAELGWTVGRNLQIDERWSRGDAIGREPSRMN